MTPNIQERPSETLDGQQVPAQPAPPPSQYPQYPQYQQYPQHPQYQPAPSGWTPQYQPVARPEAPAVANAGLRLALAIVSLLVLIPLVAIALGTSVLQSMGTAAALISLILVCAAVVGVNLIFNMDLMRPHR